jgi:mannose-6-phosphate isomerase-like protein (cupin superfamily)
MRDASRYAIDYDPILGALQKLDVQRMIDDTTEPWSNQTLCQVGDTVVRLGVVQGEFHWHKHENQDELFLVLDGLFRIEVEGRPTIELGPRDAYLVPRGIRHRPVAPISTAVLMIEQADVVATGD